MDVFFKFWTCRLPLKNVFPFPLSPAKWICDYFDNRGCGSNHTVKLITHQFICAPNVRSVKRDVARTRKKSASLRLVHKLHCKFDPRRHWRRKASMRQYIGAGMISPWFNLRAEQVHFIYNARIYWHNKIPCMIKRCGTNQRRYNMKGRFQMQGCKTGFCRKMSMQISSSVSLAGNLVKPLMFLYGTEWKERGYGHRKKLENCYFFD